MERISLSGNGVAGGQFETPFADAPVVKEYAEQNVAGEDFFSGFFREVESPFSRTYEATSTKETVTPAGEEYTDLLSELNNSEFNEMVYELANEVEDTWRGKISNEIAMGNNYIPFVTQQARNYFEPMIKESESMIDRIAQHFSGNNLADHTQSEVDQFFETLEFRHDVYTPAQENFFGKLFDKVKSVVKKGVDLAKKGISIVGKILPINIILDKIKGLVRPLLDKVLKFAIGKLPKNLQPYAETLAKKFLNLETSETDQKETQPANELEAIQTELDNHIAQLLFAPNENESEASVMNYESSFDHLERADSYETGSSNITSLEVARSQFIDDLKNLREGESPAPAIERFIPAIIMALKPVIKMAISLIGRQKIINFLAGLLAKLVGKYVPANVAQPLAAGIIDVGMSAIGFETYEIGKSDLAYETIANTIQETIQNMTMDESTVNDHEELTLNLLEAFEKAAADNFPSQYIKEHVRPTKHRAVWISMPRNSPVKLYKKFTHIYNITIEPMMASSVKIFRDLPLANFLKDKYGLDSSKPVKARVHLYETCKGGKLNMISRFEKLPGLNAQQPRAWVQLLPLTKQAANVLLNEPSIGKDFDPKSLATRFRATAGQRFYYLEIDGVRLRIPQVNRHNHKHAENARPVTTTESRSGDIQAVINFIKSEIKLNYYFSEEDAKSIVEKLNKNDFLGVASDLRKSIKEVLHGMLSKNISSKVKIVHEAFPQMYLENLPDHEEGFSLSDTVGKLAGKEVISKLISAVVEKLSGVAYEAFGKFFKARAAEFKDAQAQPQDGVTVKLSWNNITGMSAIKALIGAVQGNFSIGNLSDLTIPSFPPPEIKVVPDKKFD